MPPTAFSAKVLIVSAASTLALLVAGCGGPNDAGTYAKTPPADTASTATPPSASGQAQAAVAVKDCSAAGVSCTEEERMTSRSHVMAMERDGMEMERKGMAMALEGMEMGHKGMAMGGPEGIAMERAGMAMEREGMAMQCKGMAMAREGMVMQSKGMTMGDSPPGGMQMGNDKTMPMMDDDMPMAKPAADPKADPPMKNMPDE